MNVGDLSPSPYNPRKIGARELAKLKEQLELFGDLSGIIFNRRTGNLVGGHQRAKTLDPSWTIVGASADGVTEGDRKVGTVAIGFIKTPFGRLAYREVDWEPNIERAANLAANNPAGEWDDAKLRELLVTIDDGSGLLEMTGFDDKDLAGLIGKEPPPAPEELYTQLTFTLTREQFAEIGFAIDQAIKAGPFEKTGNENARGNAIHRICKAYIEERA